MTNNVTPAKNEVPCDDCIKIDGHWYCTMNCANCKVDRKMMPY